MHVSTQAVEVRVEALPRSCSCDQLVQRLLDATDTNQINVTVAAASKRIVNLSKSIAVSNALWTPETAKNRANGTPSMSWPLRLFNASRGSCQWASSHQPPSAARNARKNSLGHLYDPAAEHRVHDDELGKHRGQFLENSVLWADGASFLAPSNHGR